MLDLSNKLSLGWGVHGIVCSLLQHVSCFIRHITIVLFSTSKYLKLNLSLVHWYHYPYFLGCETEAEGKGGLPEAKERFLSRSNRKL